MIACFSTSLLPIAFVGGLIFVGQGAVQTLGGPVNVHNALNGVSQTIALGTVGFMEAIKQLGTNGGGFFNINSAHPFENPTGVTNLLSIFLLLWHPGRADLRVREDGRVPPPGLGRAGSHDHHLRFFDLAFAVAAEHQANFAVQAAGLRPPADTGTPPARKRAASRRPPRSSGWTSRPQTSTGSANSAYDSFTPLGGGALLTGMMLGEVTPGEASVAASTPS